MTASSIQITDTKMESIIMKGNHVSEEHIREIFSFATYSLQNSQFSRLLANLYAAKIYRYIHSGNIGGRRLL